MGTEGAFEYTHGAAINVDLNPDRIRDVIKHELTHVNLYTLTTYGQFVLMMEKNAFLFEQAKMLKECMFDHMNRMQEMSAVNVELLNVLCEDGIVNYKAAINNLKNRNNTYYSYFRKLCCINGKVTDEKAADETIQIIVRIALVALNIDLSQIPFEQFKSSKDYQRFISKEDNANKFVPNRRFETLVNVFFRNNQNDNDLLSVISGTVPDTVFDDVSAIHDIAYQSASRVYEKSAIKERLLERIGTIGTMAHQAEDAVLDIRPVPLDENNQLILNNVSSREEFLQLAKDDDVTEIIVSHSMGGFEDIHFVMINRVEGGQKHIYSYAVCNDEDVFGILSEVNTHVIFDKLKFLNKNGNSIRKMVHLLPIYVYVNVSILGLFDNIEEYFFKGKYGFFEKENHKVLVVCKKSQILIADVVSEAVEVIEKKWKGKLDYVSDLTVICNIDEVKRIDDSCHRFEALSNYDMIPDSKNQSGYSEEVWNYFLKALSEKN